MKFLISVQPHPQAIPPQDQLPRLLKGSADTLRSHLATGKLDCVYSTGQNQGFAICDATSLEQVWERIAENPLSLFWQTTVTALGDPIALTELQLRQISARQPVGAGSR